MAEKAKAEGNNFVKKLLSSNLTLVDRRIHSSGHHLHHLPA